MEEFSQLSKINTKLNWANLRKTTWRPLHQIKRVTLMQGLAHFIFVPAIKNGKYLNAYAIFFKDCLCGEGVYDKYSLLLIFLIQKLVSYTHLRFFFL